MTQSKYINNGTYGCVLRPASPCTSKDATSKDYKNTISKVFKSHKSANEELVIYKNVVKSIDPENKFTVQLHDFCQIPRSNFHEAELSKCNNLKQLSPMPNKLSQIIYEYGGIDLDKIVRQLTFSEIFIAMERVFNGLTILNKNKYVHNDIKPQNLVYNSSSKKMFIIDFGLVQKQNNVYQINNDYFLSYRYSYYPPEYITCSSYFNSESDRQWERFIRTNIIPFTNNISEYTRVSIKPIDADVHVNYMAYPDFIQAWDNLKDTGNKNFQSFLEDSLKKTEYFDMYVSRFANKIDIYMLGVTILELFSLSEIYLMNDIVNHIPFYIGVLNLIRRMIEMDPRKRISPEEAYEEYKKVLRLIKEVEVSPFKQSPIKPIKNRIDKKPTKSIDDKHTCRTPKVRNPSTDTCINPVKNIEKTPLPQKKNAKKEKPVKVCPEGKILNTKTGRCIKDPAKKEKPTKVCPEGKILNTKTGRCIKDPAKKSKKTKK